MLSEDDQWSALWDKGRFVTNIKMIDASFSMYAIDKFFVEVEHHSVTSKPVQKYQFIHGHRLDKYAGKVNIRSCQQ